MNFYTNEAGALSTSVEPLDLELNPDWTELTESEYDDIVSEQEAANEAARAQSAEDFAVARATDAQTVYDGLHGVDESARLLLAQQFDPTFTP